MRKNDNFQTSPRRAAPDVYLEGLTRTNVTQGPIWMTFTPLLGASEVVRRFLIEESPLTRMETGKFKVFSPLLDWFEEFRLYHRKDGKVVKEGDDLLAATRYGVMMLRFAETIYRKRERWPRQHSIHGRSWMGM